jgi:hypothetical protein
MRDGSKHDWRLVDSWWTCRSCGEVGLPNVKPEVDNTEKIRLLIAGTNWQPSHTGWPTN